MEANWRTELVGTIHFLHRMGWAPATSSNYSYRPDASPSFYVSASGIDKGVFSENDFIEVNDAGQAVADTRRPSAETLLHASIYRHFPEARCILHTHSVWNTLLSRRLEKSGQLVLEGYEILKGLTGITTHQTRVVAPVFPNSQDMHALARQTDAYFERHPDTRAYLLAAHGLYTWAPDIASAKRHVEVLEFLCQVTSYELGMTKFVKRDGDIRPVF